MLPEFNEKLSKTASDYGGQRGSFKNHGGIAFRIAENPHYILLHQIWLGLHDQMDIYY